MEISKLFETETAHIVRGAYSKRCAYNIHGHSYRWVIFLSGKCQKDGMIIDFGNLNFIKEFIDLFDHAIVFGEDEEKEILDFFKKKFDRIIVMKKNPTAENMARLVMKFVDEYFLSKLIYCSKVEVFETRKGRAITSRNNFGGEYDENDILVYKHDNRY